MRSPFRIAVLITGAYLLGGTAWILFSDWFIGNARVWQPGFPDGQTIKGLSYVGVTGVGLLLTLRWIFVALRDLLEESERLHASLERQLAESSSLAEIGKVISSSVRIEEVYERFAEQARKLIPFDRIVISLINKEDGTVHDAYVAGKPIVERSAGGIYLLNETVSAGVVGTRRGMVLNSEALEQATSRYPRLMSGEETGLRSMLVVPLVWQGDVTGTLQLRSHLPSPYGTREVALAEQIGAQIAGAIATAGFYQAARREAEVRRALAAIGLAASRDLDLNQVFSRVADELDQIIPSDRLVLTLRDINGGPLRIVFNRGIELPNKPVGSEAEVPGVEPGVWRTELRSDLSGLHDYEMLKQAGLKSWMEAPIGAEAAGAIGYIGLWSKMSSAYAKSDLELLERVATQITPAIQNAIAHEQALSLAEERERTTRLEAQASELERVNEAKSQFLTTVSHELKTPLTSITAFVDILSHNQGNNLSERQQRQLTVIRRNASHLNVLINDLLDISRIESGQLEVSPRDFDLRDLVRDMADSFGPVLDEKGQSLDVQVEPGDFRLHGDPDRIGQVFSNLLINASKYSLDDTTVELQVSGDPTHVYVTVRDHGIGISEEDQERIFTPFFRADDPVTRSVSGAGLGLAIVSRLVEMHGGTVSLESALGAGSAFTITLGRCMPGSHTALE
ncbi:MAG: GAF domain-containing sensor histidine kinase [Dehalococcoidia bacterium]